MSSSRLGATTLQSEVTGIDAMGFWLLVDDREYYVPFRDYPVFRQATVNQIHSVRRLGKCQFHWPDLEVDIELTALEYPERFPLSFRAPTEGDKAESRDTTP
jgi:hypothetical protein